VGISSERKGVPRRQLGKQLLLKTSLAQKQVQRKNALGFWGLLLQHFRGSMMVGDCCIA